MKTVCSNCYQEYDVEDNFLQQEVTCQVCNQDFIVNKAKFCADCGAVNPAQAFQCKQCGKDFPLPKTMQTRTQEDVPVYHRPKPRFSSAETLSGWEKLGVNWCIIVGFFSPILSIVALIALFSGNIPDFFGYVPAICMFPFGIIGAHCAYLLTMVKNPNKKIYWTPYRKFILTAFCLLCALVGIAICVVTVIRGEAKGLLVTIPITIAGCGGAITGWKLFNTRANEDADFEEDTDTVNEERVALIIKIADCCGIGGLAPLVGSPFCLVSLVLAIIYKIKGGTNYSKSMILAGLGIIINIVTLRRVLTISQKGGAKLCP